MASLSCRKKTIYKLCLKSGWEKIKFYLTKILKAKQKETNHAKACLGRQ